MVVCSSTGASRLGESLAKGAEATGKVIHKGAARIRDHITPEDVPSEVSPRVSKGLNVARKATGGAVRVSQFLGKNRDRDMGMGWALLITFQDQRSLLDGSGVNT